MNLFWRFLWTFLFARFSKKVKELDQSSRKFWVLPTDIDILGHMNNGRYLSLMDIGRLDHMIRCNVFSKLHRNKIYPVVASEMIRFRKSLKLFQHAKLTTQIMGWDDKFFYVAHHFTSRNQLYALGLIKASFLKNGKSLNTSEILKLLDHTPEQPQMPDWIKDWQKADKAFHDDSLGNIRN